MFAAAEKFLGGFWERTTLTEWSRWRVYGKANIHTHTHFPLLLLLL
jgi:hypothetical protein